MRPGVAEPGGGQLASCRLTFDPREETLDVMEGKGMQQSEKLGMERGHTGKA